MKITTVLGSPRRAGNTATVLGLFQRMISAPHKVERIKIADYTVKGCLGCGACQWDLDSPGCIQNDDCGDLLRRLMKTDVIVYATPLYVWGFAAQMKAFLDRHSCLVKWVEGRKERALLEGKRTALLVTCGDPSDRSTDLIQAIFDREMRYLGCQVVGKYAVPGCTAPERLGAQAVDTAARMARDILES
ncbi:MAG: flavodoxin family protein [Bacillota bacterium]